MLRHATISLIGLAFAAIPIAASAAPREPAECAHAAHTEAMKVERFGDQRKVYREVFDACMLAAEVDEKATAFVESEQRAEPETSGTWIRVNPYVWEFLPD